MLFLYWQKFSADLAQEKHHYYYLCVSLQSLQAKASSKWHV